MRARRTLDWVLRRARTTWRGLSASGFGRVGQAIVPAGGLQAAVELLGTGRPSERRGHPLGTARIGCPITGQTRGGRLSACRQEGRDEQGTAPGGNVSGGRNPRTSARVPTQQAGVPAPRPSPVASTRYRGVSGKSRPRQARVPVPHLARSLSVVLLACCATAMSASEEVSKDFQKSVALTGGRSLKVEHWQGNVTIRTQAKGEAEIHASMKCSSEKLEDAREGCDRIKVLVEESSSGVWVRTVPPGNDFFNGRRSLSFALNFDITMPETAPLEVHTRFGSVTVTDLHAPATIQTNNGKVVFTGGRGKQRIEDNFGNVEVTRNDGDVTIVDSNGKVTASDVTGTLEVHDNFGDINATNIGKRLDVNSANGDVTATNVTGPVNISNSFGKVTVRDAKADVWVQDQNGAVEVTGVTGTADLRATFGPMRFSRIGKGVTVHGQQSEITGDTVGGPATVDLNFGGIELHNVKGGVRAMAGQANIRLSDIGGEVYAGTSFGSVTVEDVAEPITVDNHQGSVTVRAKAAKKCQPISLTTGFGPMKVFVAPGAGYDVTAKVSFGTITAEPAMTVTGQVGGESLTGKIGGGGCMLKLVNQQGNIDILK
jgi:ribosomal protein S11